MPLYAFVDEETGAEVDLFMDWEDAPKFGDHLDVGGRKLRRVVTSPAKPVTRTWEIIAHSQPEWAAGADYYTPTGTPCFHSKASVQKYLDTQNKLAEKDGIGQTGGEILGYEGKTSL